MVSLGQRNRFHAESIELAGLDELDRPRRLRHATGYIDAFRYVVQQDRMDANETLSRTDGRAAFSLALLMQVGSPVS